MEYIKKEKFYGNNLSTTYLNIKILDKYYFQMLNIILFEGREQPISFFSYRPIPIKADILNFHIGRCQ